MLFAVSGVVNAAWKWPLRTQSKLKSVKFPVRTDQPLTILAFWPNSAAEAARPVHTL
jgi:hypothetical protein